jgi:Zn-dependent protease with chaperone function
MNQDALDATVREAARQASAIKAIVDACSAQASEPMPEEELEALRRAAATQLGRPSGALPDDRVFADASPNPGGDFQVKGVNAWRWVNAVGLATLKSTQPPLPWLFAVPDVDEETTWAGPVGVVSVSRGLLGALQSESELAFLLAHQAAHSLLGHWTQQLAMVRQASCAMQASPLDPAMKATMRSNSGPDGVAAQLLQLEGQLGFGQTQELAADALALELMQAGGYDPRVVPAMLERLPMRMHPSTEARVAAMTPALAGVHLPSKFKPKDLKATLLRRR